MYSLWKVKDGALTHLLTHLTGAPVDDEGVLLTFELAVLVGHTLDAKAFRQGSRRFRARFVWVDKSFHINNPQVVH
ncbi:hypothetical protein D3C87_1461150 [compost metagenome]